MITTPADLAPQPASTEDLWAAIEWMSTYEAGEDDPNVQALANVMHRLENEAMRRTSEEMARKAMRKRGMTTRNKAAVRQIAAQIREGMTR